MKKKVKNQPVLNGHMDFLVTIIELLHCVIGIIIAKVEIEWTILMKRTNHYRQTDRPTVL